MQQNGYRLGGEQSGHIIFSKYATTGDGLLTAIKIMEVLLESKTTLSRLVSPLEIYPQQLKNVLVTDKETVMKDADVLAAADAVSAELGEDGRVLLRPSGTEPMIRIMVEATSLELGDSYIDRIYQIIHKKGYTQL